jgi:hypothetical protein
METNNPELFEIWFKRWDDLVHFELIEIDWVHYKAPFYTLKPTLQIYWDLPEATEYMLDSFF